MLRALGSGCIASRLWAQLPTSSHRQLHAGASLLYDYYNDEDISLQTAAPAEARNAAHAALLRGVSSQLIEFQISTDEAIQRFEAHQAEACKGMHVHGLLASNNLSSVRTAYFPVWCFSCTITSEYKGTLGFKDKSTGTMAWAEMEDWRTLAHKKERGFEQNPFLQVYASYNFERGLGDAARLPGPEVLDDARDLTADEAISLIAPAGDASALSRKLLLAQQGPATRQEPLSAGTSHGITIQDTSMGFAQKQTGHTTANGQSTPDQQSKDSSSSAGHGANTDSRNGSEDSSERMQARDPHFTAIHPPDMQQAIAWQLAYRGLMQQQVREASQAAKHDTGATETRDMHVTIQIHDLKAQLLYTPVYIAHYQHGDRYKHGTDSVIIPQMFYAAISGLSKGGLVAVPHISPNKTQAATAVTVGGLGLAAGSPLIPGLDAFLPIGPVEAVTLAVISAALARLWAHGLPQARRNDITANQIRAEREFYRQYDTRETKTAAAIAAKAAEAEAAGKVPPSIEAGEQADDYMQWLWMDYDWGRWESEEPWNWDAARRWQAAEQIAARTVARRKERQQYIQKLLDERRRREQELEQELSGRGRDSRRRAGRRGPAYDGPGYNAAQPYRRRDFLGYYKLMGLQDADDITAEVIKASFKAQAMQYHPDRVLAAGGSEDAQQQAHVRFQRLQIAYDVLRDPEKRRAYDRGQLLQ